MNSVNLDKDVKEKGDIGKVDYLLVVMNIESK